MPPFGAPLQQGGGGGIFFLLSGLARKVLGGIILAAPLTVRGTPRAILVYFVFLAALTIGRVAGALRAWVAAGRWLIYIRGIAVIFLFFLGGAPNVLHASGGLYSARPAIIALALGGLAWGTQTNACARGVVYVLWGGGGAGLSYGSGEYYSWFW